MRTKALRWCVVATVGAALAGCGGGERAATVSSLPTAPLTTADPSASTQALTPTSTKRDRKAAELLLTLEDMPAGFSSPASTTSTSKKPNDLKCFAFADAVRKRDGSKAEAKFAGQGALQEVGHVVSVTSDTDAKAAFADIRKAMSTSCSETKKDDNGTDISYELQPLSFPKFGDETFAARVKLKASFITVDADIVVFRSGRVIELVSGISVPPEKLETIAEKAAAKL